MSDSGEKRSFLADPNVPKPLKIGVVVLLVVAVFWPFIGKKDKSDEPSEQSTEQPKRDVSQMGLPVSERGKELTDQEQKNEAAISRSAPAPEDEPDPLDSAEFEVFTKVGGKVPRAVELRRYGQEEIWFGTPQQIVSVGKNFTPFTQLDEGIFDQLFDKDIQPITAFSASKDSKAAVGTLTGQLLAYDRNDWRLLLPGTGEARSPITAVGLTGDNLFFSQHGLNKINLKTGALSKFPKFAEVRITTFVESTDGKIYMAAKNGVWRLIEQGWELLLPLKESDPLPISLAVLNDGRIGVGTEDGFILLDKTGKFISKTFAGTTILSLAELAPGKILLGTSGKGLRYFDGESWYEGASLRRLPSNSINKIQTDLQDNIWIAFDGAGIFRAKTKDVIEWITEKKDSSKLIDLSQPRDYPTACRAVDQEMKEVKISGVIRSVIIDQRPHVFINGTLACPSGVGFINDAGQGVVIQGFGGTVFDASRSPNATTTKFALPEAQQKATIRSAFIDSKRNLWLGTDNGVVVLLSDRVESFADVQELQGASVKAITEDDSGNIWVGTVPPYDREKKTYIKAPLHRYDGSSWKSFSVAEGLTSWTITALRFIPGTGLMMGSEAGAVRYVNDKFEKINFGTQDINLRSVAYISQNLHGHVWFSYLYSTKGVTLWENGVGSMLPEGAPQSSVYFQNAGEDKDGQLWGVTPNGTAWIFPKAAK